MPITAFNSFTDGLDPSRRSREHFITNIDIADERRWVPYADGVWFQPCHFNVTSGGFSVVLKGLPGAKLVVLAWLKLTVDPSPGRVKRFLRIPRVIRDISPKSPNTPQFST